MVGGVLVPEGEKKWVGNRYINSYTLSSYLMGRSDQELTGMSYKEAKMICNK